MELRKQLTDHLTASGTSQESASTAMGISGSALSSWRKEKYNGDNKRIEELVRDYLCRQTATKVETAAFKREFDFVETSVYTDLRKGVELAETGGEIRIVTGNSGVGKTTALQHLKELKPSSVYVRAYRGIRKNRFLMKLCLAAGISAKGSFDDLFEELVAQFRGTGRLIMVDEAEHLPIDALDALRSINDFTGCGVVIVGLPSFYRNLSMKQREYAYIYNRTSIPIKANNLTEKDVAKMVPTMIHTTIPADIWHRECNGIGRDLREIIKESVRVSKINNIQTDDVSAFTAVIRAVTKSLGRHVINNP